MSKIPSAISFAVCGKTPSREISFSVDEIGKLLVNLLTENHSRVNGRGQQILLLEDYGYRWYRVGGLDYLLKRSEIDACTNVARRT